MAELNGRYVTGVLGEMTWPAVGPGVAELEWRLRYAPASVSREDQLFLASLVAAYVQMAGDPQAKRNAVCREVREASGVVSLRPTPPGAPP